MRAYNEIYILRAFLMNNHSYSIEFFNSFMETEHYDRIIKAIPDLQAEEEVPDGSIWLKKVQ